MALRSGQRSPAEAGRVLAIVLIGQVIHSPVLGQFGSTVQNFPQVVLNGGSTTSFTIHNPDAGKTIDVNVQLYSPSGGALTDGQVELGPGETETVSFGDASAPLTRGWAELKSDDEFIATEFFQLFLAGLKPRVGVLPSPAAEEIKFLGFVNDQFKSGLAVHNPSPTEATEITLRLKDNAGQEPVAEKKLTLAPLQSEAAFLNEALLFGPSLSSFEGVVEISVNSPPVAVLSLIQEASGDVATVAVETQSFVVTGASNTSLGRGALSSNTTGINNTATGAGALMSNTTGFGNTASGHNALVSNTEGIGNTANGNSALASNSTGSSNTASGAGALFRNTSGNGNTASGHDALFSNTTGGSNTASGDRALRSNTEGKENTAVGVAALEANSVGRSNVWQLESMRSVVTQPGASIRRVGLVPSFPTPKAVTTRRLGTRRLPPTPPGSSTRQAGTKRSDPTSPVLSTLASGIVRVLIWSAVTTISMLEA